MHAVINKVSKKISKVVLLLIFIFMFTVSISATCLAPVAAAPAKVFSSQLTDIPGHWGESYILDLSRMGVVSGYATDKWVSGKKVTTYIFKPDNIINRAEFSVMLSGALGLAPGNANSYAFSDWGSIPTWARGAVAALNEQKIVEGFASGNGTYQFRPTARITRAEMVTMLTRALALKDLPGAGVKFKDVSQRDWYFQPVSVAYDLGLVQGRSAGYFVPGGNTTRAEVAAVLCRLLEKDSAPEPDTEELIELVSDYYSHMKEVFSNHRPDPLLLYADGELYLALTSGGAGLWEDLKATGGQKISISSSGSPEVIKKSHRTAQLKKATTIRVPSSEDLPGMRLKVTELFYLHLAEDDWKIYYTEVESIKVLE